MAALIDQSQCNLLIIDLQQRLLPAIDDGQNILANASKLLQCANLFGVQSYLTEQLPERLGCTVEAISAHHRGPTFQKSAFSAAHDTELLHSLEPRREIVILGTETHVCVLQTVLTLLDLGFTVWVVSDACGSRTETNKQAGLARMQYAGATLVSTEMVVFEWLADAKHEKFRDALALIK